MEINYLTEIYIPYKWQLHNEIKERVGVFRARGVGWVWVSSVMLSVVG